MKTLKKPLSMLLALVMVFGAVFAVSMTASAAGSEFTVTAAYADASASVAKTGEDVTFTVAVDATSAPFDCMKFTFTYDSTVWTFKSASWHADNALATKIADGTVTNGFQSINSATAGQVIFAVVNADVDTYRVSSAINFATVVLTAKSAAETTQVKVTPATADIGLCTDNTGVSPVVTAYTGGEYTEAATADVVVESGVTVTYGDINNDGRVNAADCALVWAHFKKTKLITDANQMTAADVNGDGRVNAADAAQIWAKFKKKLDKFPVEA